MAFNAGREFNKFASTQGAGFFGALPKKKQAERAAFGWECLKNITRYKSCREGIELAEREEAEIEVQPEDKCIHWCSLAMLQALEFLLV